MTGGAEGHYVRHQYKPKHRKHLPSFAVTMATALASWTLVAIALAENPANITECIIPSLAHANIVATASGDIGKYIATTSPFFMP